MLRRVLCKSVCDEDCVQHAWKPGCPIVSSVELGGRGQVGHFMAKRDVETWGGAPHSFFYGRGGVRLKIDRCRVIGAGSHLKQPDYHCRRLKRSKSGKRLGFVSPKWLLLITWLGWIHLTWLGEWIWCLPLLVSKFEPTGNINVATHVTQPCWRLLHLSELCEFPLCYVSISTFLPCQGR